MVVNFEHERRHEWLRNIIKQGEGWLFMSDSFHVAVPEKNINGKQVDIFRLAKDLANTRKEWVTAYYVLVSKRQFMAEPCSKNVDYQEYIQSPEWKSKAVAAKDRAEWRCQLCNEAGTNTTLHAHHRTYERLGFEEPMDITVLCAKHHAMFHGVNNG